MCLNILWPCRTDMGAEVKPKGHSTAVGYSCKQTGDYDYKDESGQIEVSKLTRPLSASTAVGIKASQSWCTLGRDVCGTEGGNQSVWVRSH